ncbi:MAG: ABC transporter ATP-binding protein [Candidatus Firestonebacteria bacterium RIFOXYC2_FULL_39_67]|nr:MAG: ABC transporter ATP-binding protein [Candidatus Firestonebacteria bacterium RIFOXYD2_FULL_39_29]OGF56563.1 MAG: ABC transporter ATP-binding protein [Candidatus Firestonebacteria bacterium RIFOXYC2_FULL_39_67]
MLELSEVCVRYGQVAAVKSVSIKIEENEIVTLLGANGAGKTSTLLAIAGINKVISGSIRLGNTLINGFSPDKLVKIGISLVPEGRKIFGKLSVLENLELGGYLRTKPENREKLTEVYEIFPVLKERQSQPGGTLSGGEQQMLAIGRALMSRPRVILMDEPSLGLSPKMEECVFKMITEINRRKTTVLLVEQNANLALKISHRAYVMETGKVKLSGNACDLLKNEEVKKLYLGES